MTIASKTEHIHCDKPKAADAVFVSVVFAVATGLSAAEIAAL